MTVSDDWRNRGLATLLMQRLIELTRASGITALFSVDSVHNDAMRRFATSLGFVRRPDPQDASQAIHSLDLRLPPAPVAASSSPRSVP